MCTYAEKDKLTWYCIIYLGEAKAPEFLAKKLGEMKALWKQTNDAAKDRLNDLKVYSLHKLIDNGLMDW